MKILTKVRVLSGLLFSILVISACSESGDQTATEKQTKPKMALLVSAQWLSDNLNDPDLVVLDSTVVVNMNDKGQMTNLSGRAGYDAGHIPTAGFADLKTNLSGGDGSLDFVMPSPEKFKAEIESLGIDNDTRVVVYSSENHVWAARMWWMLHWAGLEEVAILDGGLAAWKAEGHPLSTEPSNRTPKKFTLAIKPKTIAHRDEVFTAIDNKHVSIVDALPAAHFKGQFSLYSRPGHIPSATNSSTSDLIDESGFYKSFDELDMVHEGDRDKRVITYCGGGVAASSVAFTMHRLGYKDVAVYMGSLQEWAEDPKNPMTVD